MSTVLCCIHRASDESSDNFFVAFPNFAEDDKSGIEKAAGGDAEVAASTITGLSFRLIAIPLHGSTVKSVKTGSEEDGIL